MSLIDRRAAVQAAIALIDADGLEAFTVAKLARHMGVRAPSLYHHFANKGEILTAIARHIAGTSVIKPRRAPGADWPEYFVTLALNFRRSVLRHRNAAAVLIENLPREVLLGSYEWTARYLCASGVPVHLHLRILDGVETLCVASVLTEAMRKPHSHQPLFPQVDKRAHPHLAEAVEANEKSARVLFADHIRCFLYGVGTDETVHNPKVNYFIELPGGS
jgi:AcrR family transcriptional regulator